jgi:predicted transcriptional regulator of viral defense system
MTRSIPPSLAPVLERLELERPRVIATTELARIAEEYGIRTPAKQVAHRLVERGWLLPTDVRGVWEFAPAERAGPYSDGDPLLALQATLANHPETRATIALGSALWLLNISERAPDQHEVAVPIGQPVPVSVRRNYRVVHYTSHLEPTVVNGVPVHHPATILVHLASQPTDVRSWSGVLERLEDLVAACTYEDVSTELLGRTRATHVRLGYLLSGIAHDWVERMAIRPAGTVWFGSRGKVRRYDANWHVADTILPVSPADLVGA